MLSESAKNLPGATNKPVKVDGIDDGINSPTGSSLMQIRNDHGIRDAFN
ncbi:MAG: hypothetical protein ACOCPM_06290 [Bacteroidales bacterium]